MDSALKKRLWIFLSIVIASLSGLLLWLTRPITIGVLISLDSSVGYEENQAIQFYRNIHPRIGLRRVQLKVENPALDEESITQAFRRLEEEEVSIIIGGALSYEGLILSELSAESNLAVISPSSSSSYLSDKDDGFFRVSMANYDQGRYPAYYLNDHGVNSMVMLISEMNRSFSEPLADAFIADFQGQAVKIFNDPENPDPQAIIDLNPQGIFFILPSNEIIPYLNAFNTHLPDAQLVTSTWGYQQLLSVFSGSALDGMLVMTFTGLEMTEPFESQRLEFAELHRLNPTFASGFVFASMNLCYQAIGETGDDPLAIRNYLAQDRFIDWPWGRLYMNRLGDSLGESFYIYEIRNSQIELIKLYPVENFPNE